MELTGEWLMVCDLMECEAYATDEAADFVLNLHTFLDPYLPFREQVEGDPVRQEKWLLSLYIKHIFGDEEAANDIWNS